MSVKYPILLVYDMSRKQVGCALLQASCGGTIDNFSLAMFNNWLLAPTNEMELYKINSEEELNAAISITNKAHPRESESNHENSRESKHKQE